MEVLMISISGATCSGKTTVSRFIQEAFPHSIVFHQDDYYLDEANVPMLAGYRAWDDEAAFDWPKYINAIENAIKSPVALCNRCGTGLGVKEENTKHLVILEGIQILKNRYILTRSNLAYFIEIDKETCSKRRKVRTEDYVDCDSKFFEAVVWPCYINMRKTAQELESVKKLQGHQRIKELNHQILTDIKNLISK